MLMLALTTPLPSSFPRSSHSVKGYLSPFTIQIPSPRKLSAVVLTSWVKFLPPHPSYVQIQALRIPLQGLQICLQICH